MQLNKKFVFFYNNFVFLTTTICTIIIIIIIIFENVKIRIYFVKFERIVNFENNNKFVFF